MSNNDKRLTNEIADKLWDQLQKNPFLMGTPDFLYADATLSFKCGAYTAAVLACGACLESAVYHAVSRDRRRENKSALEIDFDYIHANWKQLVDRARETRVLNEATEATIEEVRKMSNFAGRQGQQFDETIKKEFGKGPLTSLAWVDLPLAQRVLEKTVHALNSIRANFESKRNPRISLSALGRRLGVVRDTIILLIGAFLIQIIAYPIPWVTIYEIILPGFAWLVVVLKLYRKKKLYVSLEAYAFKSLAWSIDQVAQILLATAVTIILLVRNPSAFVLFGTLLIIAIVLEFSARPFKGFPKGS